MRILHTSDWHLGVSTGPVTRTEEQSLFLDWLLGTIEMREIDVLVIAGDVFDTMHPSAEARELYYQFLARVGATGVRDIVVVGGNHDSASNLDAPRALLKAVGVHVIGGVPRPEERLARMVVPLRVRGSEAVAGVCLAVPYVHEYRLGIRTSDLDRETTRATFKAAFAKLYTELADHGEKIYPGVPLVATGHLTMGRGSKREDYPQEIHQVGNIEGLPVELLDPRIRYTALGHIHRCYRVENSTAWYCGTPISYSLAEMPVSRKVLVIDVGMEGDPVVEKVEVPTRRDLILLSGTPDEVVQALSALSWTTQLPPLVHLRVQTHMAEPGLMRRLHEAVAGNEPVTKGVGGRPVLVEVQQRALETTAEQTVAETPSLEELEPKGVFGLLCDAKRLPTEDRASLMAAFTSVEAADPEVFKEMLGAIDPSSKAEVRGAG